MLSSIIPRSKSAPRNDEPEALPPAPTATTTTPVTDATAVQDKTAFLNQSLETLHEVFPRGDVEEIRRLLATTSEESRLYVVTEILLKSRRASSVPARPVALEPWEMFRTDEYQRTVKRALSKEFRGLSKSAIQAVLAEHNFQYTRSRATLSDIASRSWRFSFSNFFRRSPRSSSSSTGGAPLDPTRVSTGCKELDDELLELQRPAREAQILADQALATALNDEEAAAASALLECQCCFGDYAWESIVACSAGHFFCTICLTRSIQESVFGQGKNLVPEKTSVLCLSSTAQPPCTECVPPAILTAMLQQETYQSLEDRTASDSLERSGLKLVRCPFCGYAEVDEIAPYRIRHSAAALGIAAAFLAVSIVSSILPYGKAAIMLLLAVIISLPVTSPPLTSFDTALRAVALQRRGTLFRCRAARCGRESCLHCTKEWSAFHKCFEQETDAARIYVEKAMADAVKRTCPLCQVSFVKSDGCNKLTCPCGYVMCYICRADIGEVGYKHFCQHFRQIPGTPCNECENCDLYANEDEDGKIAEAKKRAETEYWSRCGKPGLVWKGGEGKVVTVGEEAGTGWEAWWRWGMEGVVRWGVVWV